MRFTNKHIVFSCINIVFLLQSCKSQNIATEIQEVVFEENASVIPLEERSRRKFDNAVIADLDQDSYLDLLLTEHSRRVELFWNNNGTFEKGKPFIFGDIHGIAVGDYNKDGIIDVLVQPGGGDGKNPRKIQVYHISKKRKVIKGNEWPHFKSTRGRAVKFIDANNNGTLDLTASAFPPKDALNEAHHLYTASDSLPFIFKKNLPNADRFAMRSLLTDFNNDNIQDMLVYGGQRIVAVKGKGNYEFEEVTEIVLGKNAKTNLVKSISEIDVDNDGDFDLFITRARHPFGYESEYDTKAFYFFARRKPFLYDSLNIEDDFIADNLQMAYPHFDIFIGENKQLYKRTLDKHGEQNFKLTQKEAKGFPEDTSKKGLYIGYLGNNLWRVSGHTNSPTSMVIHNVMSQPETIPLKELPVKLLENNNGVFVDATSKFGINIPEQTTSAAIGDFNNDGWQDVFVVRYGHSAKQIEQLVLLNNKGKSFVSSKTHNITREELGATGMGADVFDYDNDGDLDIIYGNERGRWHLFTNITKHNNNYLQIDASVTKTKALPTGAQLIVKACGNIYKRVIGSGSSSYSQSYNTTLHIGLGKCKNITSAKIVWSNDETVDLKGLKINTKNKL